MLVYLFIGICIGLALASTVNPSLKDIGTSLWDSYMPKPKK